MKQAIWLLFGLFKCCEIFWGCCHVRCLPGSLARRMQPARSLHGQPQIRWFLCLPFGLLSLPWCWSMLVTMATGVESGHLVHLSGTTHTHPHSTSPFSERVRSGYVCLWNWWWFGGHVWWSLGSLRPDYWPTSQLVDHMDGSYSPPHHSTPADLLVLFNESLGSPAP